MTACFAPCAAPDRVTDRVTDEVATETCATGGLGVCDNDFDSETGATEIFSYSGAALTTIDCGLFFVSGT